MWTYSILCHRHKKNWNISLSTLKWGMCTNVCSWQFSLLHLWCQTKCLQNWSVTLICDLTFWSLPFNSNYRHPSTSAPIGWPNGACGTEVSARHGHVSVHHRAPGRHRAHPAVPLQFTCRRHPRDHRDLPERTLHWQQCSTHVPGSHLLGGRELTVEEEVQERKIASCDATPAFVYVSYVLASPCLFPPQVPVSFLGIASSPTFF